MSKKEWAIFKTCRKRDQGVSGSGKPEFVNVIERDLGIHVSRDAAVRALVVNYYPELNDSDIEHIKRVSKEFLRGTMGHYKIMTY
ncbi:hypothetical protein L8R84_05305 [Vibrio splendidus]|uniref:hypothetical protein n=1 Tax=Vibrio splendidus TaxID=29497 RepID=UPI002469935A|nr:hypothetical protein [Vibrio splendidus]MDH5935556.1 hypothetical protein [Vibrio splendidus]